MSRSAFYPGGGGQPADHRIPETVEEVWIIDTAGLDCRADGGTHVASTR
ncbi:hypothetical protein AB0395_22780 [Streptosporangium sp. NPDC051023]